MRVGFFTDTGMRDTFRAPGIWQAGKSEHKERGEQGTREQGTREQGKTR
jgi:hypothetical protein